jgi:hypothetical protein
MRGIFTAKATANEAKINSWSEIGRCGASRVRVIRSNVSRPPLSGAVRKTSDKMPTSKNAEPAKV